MLDSLILLDVDYKSHYNTVNSNNNLITSAAVKRIGHAKMNQEYLGFSDDKVAFAFGKAAVLDYDESTSIINRFFVDNNQPEEYKETFKKWLTVGDENGAPVNELVYTEEGVPHLFMEYLQEAMKLDDEELLALSSLMEINVDGKSIFTAHGIQNMVTAWQLADAYGLKIEEFVNYCQFIQFDVTKPLVDSLDTLTDAQKIVIAHQSNLLDLMFLLNHQGTEEELQEFDEKALKLAENIFEKKAELEPELPELPEGQSEHTPEILAQHKADWVVAIEPIIKEQLQLTTDLDLVFVEKAFDQQTEGDVSIADLVVEAESSTNEILNALKRCTKALSLCELMGIEEVDLTEIASSPVAIFNLPLDTAQAVSYDNFSKLSAICQAEQYLIEGKNRFEFYKFIDDNAKVDDYSNLAPFIDWYTVLPFGNTTMKWIRLKQSILTVT